MAKKMHWIHLEGLRIRATKQIKKKFHMSSKEREKTCNRKLQKCRHLHKSTQISNDHIHMYKPKNRHLISKPYIQIQNPTYNFQIAISTVKVIFVLVLYLLFDFRLTASQILF